MAKENKDVLDQLVEGQGAEAQITNEQGVEGQVAADVESPDDVQQAQDEQKIPYTRFKEVNDQKNAAEEAQKIAEEQLQQSRDQMALMQAQPRVEPQKSVSNYEQALTDCGLRGEEYLSEEQRIQVNARKDEIGAVQRQQNQQVVANQQFAQSHPDFAKTVGQVNQLTGQFMASAELQKILMEKPYLSASCLTAQGAYNIVLQERRLAELSQKATAMEAHQGQQDADNKTGPMSPSSVAGGGVSRKKGKITESSTADDVRAMESRVKAGEFD